MPSASGFMEAAATGRHERTGKAREVGPGARRPPSDRKAEKPSWKGVAHMHKLLSGLVAGIALLAAAPAALAGPTVTVRVESPGGTLLERTTVTLPDRPSAGNPCGANTAAAALDAGTGDNWDHAEFTQTILGETHKFDNSDYWAEWIARAGTGYERGAGICSDTMAAGDELLMLVDVSPPPSFAPTVFPLDLEGVPAQASRGDSVTVTVVEYRSATGATGEGARTPVAGATISGGGTTATSGADGKATLRLDQTGSYAIKATRQGNAPSAGELVSVAMPGQAPPPPGAAARDTAAPVTTVGLRDGAVFSRRRAPRLLRGRVSQDPSGLYSVKLRLTQRLGRHCSYFSGRRERFRRMHCGGGSFLRIGDQADWSYLLPKRLGRGRYVLEAKAIDTAFNRGAPARVRFRVK